MTASLYIQPPPTKAWYGFDEALSVRYSSAEYPNAFVRFMQRRFLGMYWRRA